MTEILFLAITTFIVIRTIYKLLKKKDPEKDPESIHYAAQSGDTGDNTVKLLFRILKELNCKPKIEIEKEKKETVISFEFQGGHFRINVSSETPYVKLAFLFIFEASFDNLDLIRYLCNQLNINVQISKFVYSTDVDTNCVHVHLFIEIPLMKEIPAVKAYFESFLTSCFELKRTFIRRFDELSVRNNEKPGTDIEKERTKWHRELFLLREQELSHQNNEWQWRLNETNHLTLGQFLDKICNLQEDSLKELKIVTDELKIITDPDRIKDFNLLSPIISFSADSPKIATCQDATLIITYVDSQNADGPRIITINLKSEGETTKSLYVRITCSLVPVSIKRTTPYGSNNNVVKAYSFLIAWDKLTEDQRNAEFEYMWQDAKEKAEKGEADKLTEEQQLIYDCIHPGIAYHIYWGKAMFLDKRYYEALLYLENAYSKLQENYHSMHDSHKEKFYEVCYLTGFCHCELFQYQQAYYFLDIVFNQNQITYTQEYVNCLTNSKDFRAIMVIDKLLDIAQPNGNAEENTNPAIISFINFLRRRKAYTHIDLKQLDKAEEIFKVMLDEPENSDFALNELAYIQKLKGRHESFNK
jgi:hypothetical protein